MRLVKVFLGAICCLLCCINCDLQAQSTAEMPAEKVLPFVVFAPKPAYPTEARAARAVGPVKVDVRFNPDGDVVDAKFASGNRLLKEPTLKAARKWKFNSVDESIGIRGVRLTFVFHTSLDGFVESTREDLKYKYRINLIYYSAS